MHKSVYSYIGSRLLDKEIVHVALDATLVFFLGAHMLLEDGYEHFQKITTLHLHIVTF